METARVEDLWEKYSAVGCIGEDDFVAYFASQGKLAACFRRTGGVVIVE